MPGAAATHWVRSGHTPQTAPSNWKAFSWCVRPVAAVRVPKGRILRVTFPAGQVQAPASRSIWKSSFGKCFRSGRPGTLAVSILDVFQSIQRQGVPFMLILSGLPTLFPGLVEARTFAERMFRVVTLDRLDKDSCEEAITKPLEDSGSQVRFTSESVENIYQATKGYPYFVQFFCRESFDLWLNRPDVAVPLPDIQRKLDSDFFAGRWYRATDRQRDLLTLVVGLEDDGVQFTVQDLVRASSALERPFSASHVGQILSSLCDSGFVYRNRRGRYSLTMPLLDGFIMRQS